MEMSKRILGDFQPKRLTQARIANKLNMAELADRLDVTRQAVSSFENASSKPSPQTLRDLSVQLKVPEAFFFTPIRESETKRESTVNFRSLAVSKKKARAQSEIYLEWLVSIYDFVGEYISLPKIDLPDFDISDFRSLSGFDIESLAAQTRRHFGLGDGPISNLCKLVENKGVAIGSLKLESGMDGLSAWYNRKPAILISNNAFHARGRFDLAHELFHLIAHKSVTEEELEDKELLATVESQAHRFAGAFLAPNTTFINEVYSLDIESLVDLKKRWGISIQAIIMRLNDFQIVTDSQKIRFFSKLNAEGMRKVEPLDKDIEPERPQLMKRIAEFLNENQVILLNDFLRRTGMPEWFATSVSGVKFVEPEPPNDPNLPDNIIKFNPNLKRVG